MNRWPCPQRLTATLALFLASMGHARAETYSILSSSAASLSPGQSLEEGQAISLAPGETISFTILNQIVAVQRRCSGPYKGVIRTCTNASAGSRPGIPGGSRGSDD